MGFVLEYVPEVFNFLIKFLAGGYDGIFVFGYENQTYKIIENVLRDMNNKNKGKNSINSFPIEITDEGLLIY